MSLKLAGRVCAHYAMTADMRMRFDFIHGLLLTAFACEIKLLVRLFNGKITKINWNRCRLRIKSRILMFLVDLCLLVLLLFKLIELQQCTGALPSKLTVRLNSHTDTRGEHKDIRQFAVSFFFGFFFFSFFGTATETEYNFFYFALANIRTEPNVSPEGMRDAVNEK